MDFSKLNLYELRTIARELGVRSPSSLTKAKLIEQIQKSFQKDFKPYFTTKGRKPLGTNLSNNKTSAEFKAIILEALKATEELELRTTKTLEEIKELQQNLLSLLKLNPPE